MPRHCREARRELITNRFEDGDEVGSLDYEPEIYAGDDDDASGEGTPFEQCSSFTPSELSIWISHRGEVHMGHLSRRSGDSVNYSKCRKGIHASFSRAMSRH